MKTLIFLAAAMVLSANVFANNKKENNRKAEPSPVVPIATTMIQGTVVDQITGEALTGVKVLIEETNQIVYTDFDGNFAFNSLTTGEYSIKVDYISYKTNRLRNVKAKQAVNSIKVGLLTVNE